MKRRKCGAGRAVNLFPVCLIDLHKMVFLFPLLQKENYIQKIIDLELSNFSFHSILMPSTGNGS